MFWLGLSLITLALVLAAYLDTRKPKGFPPGPRWYPLIGSALQVSRARARLGSLFEATAEMSRKYGPVIGLKIGKSLLVIVYGPQVVKEMSMSEDLLGRPIGPYYEMRTWNKRLGLLLTDKEFWHEQKRFVLRHLKQFGYGTKHFSSLVEEECIQLVNFIEKSMDDGDSVILDMEKLFNVSVLNSLWRILCGVRYSPEASKMKTLQSLMADMFKVIHMVGAPFSHFPILKYIAPEMSGYKSYVETHKHIWTFLQQELDEHKKTHDPDNPKDFMDVYLNVLRSPDHGESFSEEQLMAICLDMFMAGSETTNNTISFGMLYLMLNPKVQRMAQKEIDTVLRGRQATLDDRSKMPYMEAVMLESLRMFGFRAFSVPHRALKDTYLAGYRIPKDVYLSANYHGSMMGPDSGFDKPELFDPDRYLINGKLTIPANFTPFGLGKRRCLGESLARDNIFLIITSLLQKFDIDSVSQSPPDMKVVDGVTPGPLHYKARLTRRRS